MKYFLPSQAIEWTRKTKEAFINTTDRATQLIVRLHDLKM